MTTSQHTPDPRTLALAWLWSRPPSEAAGDPVDLETLDQWRQGLLSPTRSAEVKSQLASDPRLMRMLEELVATDDLLNQWSAEEKATERGADVWTFLRARAEDIWVLLRTRVGEALSRLRDTRLDGGLISMMASSTRWTAPSTFSRLAGGLVVVTASLVLVVVLVPTFTKSTLDRRLDNVYAALHAPSEELTLPWGPRIAMRGARRTERDTAAAASQRLAKRAFQAGMVERMAQLSDRYPGSKLKPGDRLDSELPTCDPGGRACRQQVELAHTTGSWALAVYLQCQGTPAADQSKALDLLPQLNAAWRELAAGHPLGDQANAIAADQYPCGAVERLLRTWGRLL